MIEIHLDAFFEGKLGIVAVIIVLLQNDDAGFRQRFDNSPRNRRLSGARAAAYPDN
jgi:hypothetical protein